MLISTKKIKLSYEEAIYLAILFMTFYTAPLFSFCPVRFSDIGGLILLYIGYKASQLIQYTSYNILYLILAIWIIIDFCIIPLIFPLFSFTNHITQSIRLELAILTFLYIPNIFRVCSFESILRIIKKVILTHAWIQIIYVILYFLHIRFCFNLIENFDERLALISGNGHFFNHFIIVNVSEGSPRFSGLFEEPAWFGWNMNLMLGFVLQSSLIYPYKSTILTYKNWIVILLSFIFTFSISAIGSLGIIIFTYSIQKYKHHIGKLLILFIGLTSSIVLYIILNPSILARLLLISEGGDGSTSSRIIGSWNALITTLHTFPITGYGLGDFNSTQFFTYAKENTLLQGIKIGNIHLMEIHNLICQIICNLGIIGGILLLQPFMRLIKPSTIIIGISFLLMFFSVNVYNTFFFFTMASFTFYFFLSKYKFNL